MPRHQEFDYGIDKMSRKKKNKSTFFNEKIDTSWMHLDMKDIYVNKRYTISEERLHSLWMVTTDEYYEANRFKKGMRKDTIIFWNLCSPKTSIVSKNIVFHKYAHSELYNLFFLWNRKVIQDPLSEAKASLSSFNLKVDRNFVKFEEGADEKDLGPEGLYMINKSSLVMLNSKNLVFTVIRIYQYRGNPDAVVKKDNHGPIIFEHIEKNRILNNRHSKLIALGSMRIGSIGESKNIIMMIPVYVLGKQLEDEN